MNAKGRGIDEPGTRARGLVFIGGVEGLERGAAGKNNILRGKYYFFRRPSYWAVQPLSTPAHMAKAKKA